MCRFLDAGNSETLHTLGGPASKKRQGTKSREVVHRLGSERYGDYMSGALSSPISVGAFFLALRFLLFDRAAGFLSPRP